MPSNYCSFFTLPFDTGLSKNRAKTILGRGRKKFIGLTEEYRAITKNYIAILEPMFINKEFKKQKVYITMRVFKPNHRSDAINLVDGMADILKKVMGLDDRYFSVWCDWEIDKENPRVEIYIDEDSLPSIQ